MGLTRVNLDKDAIGRVFSFGGVGAGQDALVTINKGTAAVSTIVLDVLGSQSIAGDLTLLGNLNITGDINRTTVTELNVTDKTIRVNNGGTTAGAAGAGLTVEGDTDTTIGAITFAAGSATKFQIGNGTAQADIVDVSSVQTLTNKSIAGSQITGNIGGNAANVTGIVGVANGGTGAATFTSGYLKANGTNAFTTVASIAGADVSGNIGGNAANVTGIVAIANGGTGASSSQGAINATNPHTTLGDISFRDATNVTRLPGNTAASKMFLSQTGTGTVSAAPIWSAVTKADVGLANVENTALSTFAGSGNITTVGTITSGTWSGSTIAVSAGGTGLNTLTQNSLLVGAGTGSVTFIAPGASGNVLTSNGTVWTSAAPAPAAYTKEITVTGTQDGANKTFTLSNAPAANSAQVFVNGVARKSGASNDFLVSGTTLTFQTAMYAPDAADIIMVYGVY